MKGSVSSVSNQRHADGCQTCLLGASVHMRSALPSERRGPAAVTKRGHGQSSQQDAEVPVFKNAGLVSELMNRKTFPTEGQKVKAALLSGSRMNELAE